MSQNYTKFSEVLILSNDEQRAWCKKYLPLFTDNSKPYDKLWDDLRSEISTELFESTNNLSADFNSTTQAEVTNDGLWLYSEESESVEMAANFAQCVLQRFDDNDEFWISWADYGDKLATRVK